MATATRNRRKDYDKEAAAARREEKRQKVDAMIEDGLAMLTDPDHWKRYLSCATANEGRRSFRNQLLIMMQSGGYATDCEGYTAWMDRGRVVRKGEAGMMVFAPVTKTVPLENGKPVDRDVVEGDETARKMAGLRIAFVFDIAQTEPLEGKPQKPAKGARPVDPEELRETIEQIGGDHTEAILAALDEALEEDAEDEDAEDEDAEDEDAED